MADSWKEVTFQNRTNWHLDCVYLFAAMGGRRERAMSWACLLPLVIFVIGTSLLHACVKIHWKYGTRLVLNAWIGPEEIATSFFARYGIQAQNWRGYDNGSKWSKECKVQYSDHYQPVMGGGKYVIRDIPSFGMIRLDFYRPPIRLLCNRRWE